MTGRELTTGRLLLRQWRDSDLDPLAAMDGDPVVMRYIGDGSTFTREQTETTLARLRDRWREQGFGHFAVEVCETGEFAGWVGLAPPTFLPEVMPAVEIGWRLGRAHWGRGYATEAARAVLRFGFEEVGLERIVSICQLENAASARVMAKLGMTVERRTTVPNGGAEVQVTELVRESWLSSR